MTNGDIPVFFQKRGTGPYADKGANGEDIVMAWLKQRADVRDVVDLRKEKPMFRADIDCMVCYRNGVIDMAEIKSDDHLGVSGNILFEYARVNHTVPPRYAVTLGWTARSPATKFYFYAPQVKRIYECIPDALRQALQRYTHEARSNARTRWINTSATISTINILIPEAYCKGVFRVHDLEATRAHIIV